MVDLGLEPIQMQGSGGALLQPVQTLVATFIFFRWRKKMHIESYIVPFTQCKFLRADSIRPYVRRT